MILLTGATGTVGFEIAGLLDRQGLAAKALVRSPEAAEKLAGLGHIVPVRGDLDDAASVAAALEGVETAFLLTRSSERAEAQQLGFVAAAKAAGVRHIVKLSQVHADMASPVRFLRYHAVVEAAIKASGMAYTMLRANLFMQEMLAFREPIRQQGRIFAPIGEAAVSLVDARDLAEGAVAALTGPGHEGRSYDLTGPEALSHAELADRIGRAIGRRIEFVQLAPEQMRQIMLSYNFPEWQTDGLIEDYAHYDRGEAAAISGDIEAVTGRKARSFEVFLGDYGDRLRG